MGAAWGAAWGAWDSSRPAGVGAAVAWADAGPDDGLPAFETACWVSSGVEGGGGGSSGAYSEDTLNDGDTDPYGLLACEG